MTKEVISIIFEAIELGGVLEGLEKFSPKLDVRERVVDLGIEDIAQAVLPQEQVADPTHAGCVLVVAPYSSEARYAL